MQKNDLNPTYLVKRNFWYEMEGVVFNDCFIISFEGEHQMLWLLNAHDMHVNDDYASTSRVKLFWKFYGLYYNIWSKPYNLMHRNSIFFFRMINESTDWTMEQHLMFYCCSLTLKGKRATTISFVELIAIKDSMGEYMYLSTKSILEIL